MMKQSAFPLCACCKKPWCMARRLAGLLALVWLVGCGSSQAPVARTEPSQSAGPQIDTAVAEAGSVGEQAVVNSSQPTTAEVDDSQPLEDLDSLVATATSQTAQASDPIAPAATAPVVTVSAPTAEQLQRWAIAEFDPLQLLACTDPEQPGVVSRMIATPDGNWLVVGGTKVNVWRPTATAPDRTLLDLATESARYITALAVAASGEWVCAGDSEGKLYAWSWSDGRSMVAKQIYNNDITDIAISPAGDEVATLTFGSQITIWDTNGWNKKSSFECDTPGVERILYVGPQRLVASGETTSLWDTTVGKVERQLSPGRYQFAMALTPDTRYFAIGTEAGLQFWNSANLEPGMLLEGDFRAARLAFSKDQKFLAVCAGKDIYIYDLPKRQLVQILEAAGAAIVGLAWAGEGHLLANINEWGRLRVWGDAAAAQTVQLVPLHAPVKMPDSGSSEPATASQLQAALDPRTLPKLPGAKVALASDTSASYAAPGTVSDAKAFYHHLLGTRGWQALPGNEHTADYLYFSLHGIQLFISLTQSAEQVEVSLSTLGNVDLRTLPQLDQAEIEPVYANDASVSYTTKLDLLSIETKLLRRLRQAGWIPLVRLNASHTHEPDVRDLEFTKNSIVVRVSVRKFPATPDRYTVQMMRFLGLNALPLPTDVDFFEGDVSSGESRLVATTSLDLAQARQFYDTALVAQGWLPRSSAQSEEPMKSQWLNYIRGQRDLTVGLMQQADGQTLIRVGEDLEKLSWQLKKTATADAADKPAAGTSATAGLEAADFPLLSGTNSLSMDTNSQELQFKLQPAESAQIVMQYLSQMEQLGWKPAGEGIREATYVFLTFGKDDKEINLRANIRDQLATVSVEGDGLLWNKPLNIQPKLVSYADWLRQRQQPASLRWLDEYERQMRPLVKP